MTKGFTWGDSKSPPKSFRLIVPADLMLPEYEGELPGVDPTETPGYRAGWLIHWTIANGTNRVQSIPPRAWKIDIGNGPAGFDVRLLPDEYLLASLTDISLRLSLYQDRAIHLLLERPENWRPLARELIMNIQSVETERFSKYNGPYRPSLYWIPREFRDRVRDVPND